MLFRSDSDKKDADTRSVADSDEVDDGKSGTRNGDGRGGQGGGENGTTDGEGEDEGDSDDTNPRSGTQTTDGTQGATDIAVQGDPNPDPADSLQAADALSVVSEAENAINAAQKIIDGMANTRSTREKINTANEKLREARGAKTEEEKLRLVDEVNDMFNKSSAKSRRKGKSRRYR